MDEEKVFSSSLGMTRTFAEKGEVSVTFFRQDVDDLIAYQEDEDGIKRPENIEDAWRQGVLSTLKRKLSERTDLGASFIWQNSRNGTDGRDLAYTPDLKFQATLKRIFDSTDTRLEISLRAVDRQYSDLENSEEKKVAGYATVDLKAVQPLQWRKEPLEFFAQIFNLFDKDFETHHGYPDDGFRFVAGLNIEYLELIRRPKAGLPRPLSASWDRTKFKPRTKM